MGLGISLSAALLDGCAAAGAEPAGPGRPCLPPGLSLIAQRADDRRLLCLGARLEGILNPKHN
ncbi:hypothetical protein [Marinibacterium profundimaris]|uniref:hypothetical protein n=1 Tax=Marinibacterium profundimaris TaxID=1679460 RepID=UPI00117D217A|nr:hypothetical protein [Marinibacterium profundimaris]